ncbi:MAG: aminotransferase class I/II-fold pyridoxal phosphate-dependent enzyme [Anaerolineae bacterium]|jgi:LL-diaminopimelate aminotransferase|nr:aminotransferase class I/II-fold pyridoxal phosphate-dependent enzyme [Anaerolineae bacterium]MCZ7553288.1 aminotransferase class I/II-fold pyridoxal phosphate-dependent enzyme [Anaerolineales bacterium]
MEVKPAARMDHLKPHFFAALNARLAALQAQGKTVIRLDEGAPDLPPAPHIVEALVSAARRADAHSYQPHRGSRALRAAWADWYLSQHGVTLNPENEILPLLGSKEGVFHLSQAFLQPGDLALVPDPGYVTYTRGALFAGAQVAYFPLLPERGYLPELQALDPEALARCKLLWLNYPNNPTGAAAPLELFEQAVELARRYNFIVCHDAAYSQVAFDGLRPPSLLQVDGAREVAVEFNTLSKSHNMAGWRSGALLGNPQVVRALFTLKTNADSSHFLPVFEASITALTGDQTWLVERNEIYRRRRDAALAGLRDIGLSAATPPAALYVWARLPQGWESEAFALAALEGAGVSVTPGTVFGANGQGYIRVALCAPVEEIETAMQRLGGWLRAAR